MTKSTYIQARKKYTRPQAMLWADNPGTVVDGLYVPLGNEVTSDGYFSEAGSFMVLTDDNRDKISFTQKRIEQRARMINGRMRSYHIADKLSIATSWTNVPSRGFSKNPEFTGSDLIPAKTGTSSNIPVTSYTTDNASGGGDILDWYENHQGSFWVYLAYDKYANFVTDPLNSDAAYGKLGQYNEIVEVFFSDFSHSVVKRGGSNFDFWDISLTLEEV